MKSIFYVFTHPFKAFQILDKAYEDDVFHRAFLILGLGGVINSLTNTTKFVTPFDLYSDLIVPSVVNYFYWAISILLIFLANILLFFVISFLTHKISQFNNKPIPLWDAFNSYAYAYLPFIVGNLLFYFLNKDAALQLELNNTIVSQIIVTILYLLSIRIAFVGNQYASGLSFWKTLVCLIPFLAYILFLNI